VSAISYAKPLPVLTPGNLPFWEASKAHEFKIPRCAECRAWVFPIAPMCQNCWSDVLAWEPLSGWGIVSSWVVFHRAFDPSYTADVPYAVVQIDLDEGIRFISNLTDVAPHEIRVGLPVEAFIDDVTPDVTLVKFRRRRVGSLGHQGKERSR
jgi:uncharacterized OB-fold protein